MTKQEFDKLLENQWNEILKLSNTKGVDYSDGKDRLSNFKEQAAALGLDPLQVWGVYANKHWSAINAFIRNGKMESEPLQSRIHDVILYLLLLTALIDEKH